MWIELCLCVFFIPWGHVNKMTIFGHDLRHNCHVGEILDSDWLIQILLRSDWLGPMVALCTTVLYKT